MCDQVLPVTPVKKNKRGKVRINLSKMLVYQFIN